MRVTPIVTASRVSPTYIARKKVCLLDGDAERQVLNLRPS